MNLRRLLLLAALVLFVAGCGGGGSTSGEAGQAEPATTGASEDTARFEIDNAKQFVLFAVGNDPGSAMQVTHDYVKTVRKHVEVIGVDVAKDELRTTAGEVEDHCGKCAKLLARERAKLG
jgi:hypothetical protein